MKNLGKGFDERKESFLCLSFIMALPPAPLLLCPFIAVQ